MTTVNVTETPGDPYTWATATFTWASDEAQAKSWETALSGSIYGLEVGETTALAEAISKILAKPVSESVGFAESAARGVALSKSESFLVAESAATQNQFARSYQESFALSEGQMSSVGVGKFEALSVSEQVVKDAAQSVAESLTVSEADGRDVAKPVSEAVSLAEAQSSDIGVAAAEVVYVGETSREGFGLLTTSTQSLTRFTPHLPIYKNLTMHVRFRPGRTDLNGTFAAVRSSGAGVAGSGFGLTGGKLTARVVDQGTVLATITDTVVLSRQKTYTATFVIDDATKVASLYLDGQLVGSATTAGLSDVTSDYWVINTGTGAHWYRADAILYECGVFTKAPSEDDIQRMINGDYSTMRPHAEGLFLFNEGDGTTLIDESPYAENEAKPSTWSWILDSTERSRFDVAQPIAESLSLIESDARSTQIARSESLGVAEGYARTVGFSRAFSETLLLVELLGKQYALPLSEALRLVGSGYYWGNAAFTWEDQEANLTWEGAGSMVGLASGFNRNFAEYVAIEYGHRSPNWARGFDGVTDNRIVIPNDSSLQVTGDLTIEVFLRPRDFGARRNPVNKAYGGEYTITQEKSGSLSFYWGTSGANATPYQGFGSPGLTLGAWNHCFLVRDLTNGLLKWNVNGNVNTTAPGYAAAAASAANVLIGSGYAGNYTGVIAELRIYSRALTDVEITERRQGIYSNRSGEVLYLPLNEGVGSAVYDQSGTGNDGTSVAPIWVEDSPPLGCEVGFGTAKPVAEQVSVVDVLSRTVTFLKSFGESWAVLDTLTKSAEKSVLEGVAVADSRSSDVTHVSSEAIAVADSVSKVVAQSLNDAFGFVDALVNGIGANHAEGLSVQELVAKSIAVPKQEALGLGESLTNGVMARLFEQLVAADALSSAVDTKHAEGLSVQELISKSVDLPMQEVLLLDSFVANGISVKLFEQLAAVDGLVKSSAVSIAEYLLTQDVLAKGYTLPQSETVAVQDQSRHDAAVSLAESLSVIDVWGRVVAFQRALSEGLSVQEATGRAASLPFAETFALADEYRKNANAVVSDMLIAQGDITPEQFAALLEGARPPGFGEFQPFINGDYEYKRALMKVAMTATGAERAAVRQCALEVDVPDVFDGGTASVVSGGTEVLFNREFHEPPEVAIVWKGGTSIAIPRLLEITKQSFIVELVTPEGVGVSGTVSWSANGY